MEYLASLARGHGFVHFAVYSLPFLELSLAGALTALQLYRHEELVRRCIWGVFLILGISFFLMLVASRVYFQPPVMYYGPVTRATPNSFPSHHAMLAALSPVLVGLVARRWTLPFIVGALLTDVSLVIDKDHHVIDVVASDCILATAFLFALLATRPSIFASRLQL